MHMIHGYKAPIEELTKENTDFRRVLYTAAGLQLVLMSLAPGEEIGLETHDENDQFFRFEAGEGEVVVNGMSYTVTDGDCVIVPKGTLHNVINHSASELLRFYTLYAPAHHRDGTVHTTKTDALEHEADFDGTTTE